MNWFRVLEQAGDQRRFSANKNMVRLGFIPGSKNEKWNPDGLPVGFLKEENLKLKEMYLGVTCAACHTGQAEYQGK